MPAKPSAEAHDDVSNSGIPASLLAQTEAAIIGEFEDEPVLSRRPSRVPSSDPSQYQNAYGTGSGESAKNNNLQVPGPRDDDAPPAYGDRPDEIEVSQDGFNSQAKITDDGRININISQKTRKLSDLLVPALRNQLSLVAQENPLPAGYIPPCLGGAPGQCPPPRMNVVIHVVGSRGDVQPFVALGKVLKNTYGHRVRLATHPTFKTFVEENGLEFFSIGGDPAELMAFMVKNPGLMPGFDSLKSGDVGKRRRGMEEIVLGCWRSCIEAGDGLGPAPKKDDPNMSIFEAGINMDANPGDLPFIADAIIANPPSFAHVHIAEKMGIPLHMMFTMPWSPTQSFPHPLANIQSTNADTNMTNFVSYAMVEMMTWQGLGDVINRFRERALGLEPISLIWAPGMLSRLRIPYTYCWSPALIPKPKDWGQHISISGFYFLSLASSYTPAPDLAAYLAAGPPPVYIGFGSIVVDDPDSMTKLIFEAVKKSGVRALVSKGWGGLGADELGVPEGVFMLGNVPHDWLFQHVSCVVHHGGAGTTAAGIATGKPTIVVPFFGDQPFWGAMVARAGAGPLPIPYKHLTADKLSDAILEAIKPETLAKAKELGAMIKEEQGCDVGGKSFHDHLDVESLRCSLAPDRVAVWRIKRTKTRLSALAANVLANHSLLDFSDLKLYRPKEYDTEEGPWDPISGGASALLGTIASLGMGVADFPIEAFKKVKTIRTDTMHTRSTSGTKITKSSTSNLKSTNSSSSTSQTDLALTEGADPRSSSDTASQPKTSYESTIRSSSETPLTDTPLTSTTSLGSLSSPRTGSMKAALSGALHRSGSRSGSRDRSSHTRSQSKDRAPGSRSSSPFCPRRRATEEFDPSQLTMENVSRGAKGVARIVGAGLKSPMDFTLGIARGFHNAPKLYGDDTVRQQEKVTDFQSGLKAATKEFGYGMFDGITGLVTQPIRGAEKDGAAGLIKGIGKGIGGLILKPGAAVWAIPGYTFMGVHKEIRKLFGSSVMNYTIAARAAQGFEEAKNASKEECDAIVQKWNLHKEEYLGSKKTPDGQESGHLTPKGFMQTRHLTFDERKKLHEDRKARREEERKRPEAEEGVRHRLCPFCRRTGAHNHTPRAVQTTPIVLQNPHPDQDEQFEHAIHASVAATSRGNAEEDAIIERAIRASVRELKAAQGSTLSDQEALERAIQASIEEGARRPRQRRESSQTSELSQFSVETVTITKEEAEHQAALAKAIQDSLAHYELPTAETDANSDDDDMKLALQMSKEDPVPNAADETHARELAFAIQRSKEETSSVQTEEEIVMEYVRKHSLFEEQLRAKLEGKKEEEAATPPKAIARETRPEEPAGGESSAADEEALRLAIEASMKEHNGAESSA